MTRNRRGVALILVLWLVVILSVISAGFVRAARTSSAIASNARAAVIARAAAESGIEATVADIEDSLTVFSDAERRRDLLNAMAGAVTREAVTLGDARFMVALVDVSARLDVNAATETALTTFFSQFTDAAQAAAIARAIRVRIDSGGALRGMASPSLIPRTVSPIRSLEELQQLGLVPSAILAKAAPYLTVDGDGVINQRTASDTVLVAATGELRDEPSRLLLISRGWVGGNPLTCEIQAVYAISGNRLVFLHWRERSL